MRMIKTTAVAVGLLMSALAQAHPKLLSSTPAEGADGAAPSNIELHFSENLMTQFSGAKLVMTEMPGMALSPLPTGSYKVEWRAVSSDTHPITGNVTFKVK
jgi:methionine-rich copper-binding protein CopC